MPGQETIGDGETTLKSSSRRVLVLDTAALIAAADSLFALGGLIEADGTSLPPRAAGEHVDFVLVSEVAQEVKDPRARARLALLSQSATVLEPSAQAMDAVIRFSKATGDFAALSRVDLKVLGLAWMLETELNGMQNLRDAPAEPSFAPTKTISMQEAIEQDDERLRKGREQQEKELAETEGWVPVVTVKNPGRPREQPREHRPKPKKLRKRQKKKAPLMAIVDELADAGDATEQGTSPTGETAEGSAATASMETEPEVGKGLEEECSAAGLPSEDTLAKSLSAALDGLKTEEHASDACLSEEDDGVGWINSENLEEQMARDSGGQDALPEDLTTVGCVTTDFAMQNVLLQMGINLVSVDGRRVIRRVRRYVLRCQSCSEITRELERLFCGRCGNATLTRVTFDVDKNGVARIFLSSKFKPRLRGTIYPIPMPRGGRNNKDLILCEDQIDPVKLRRAAKQRERAAVDVLDPDTFYKFGTKQVQHRPLVVGYGSRNPNEGKPSTKVSRR